MTSDPIADMLTRIRNGAAAGQWTVRMPASKAKVALATVLRDEGFIAGFETSDDGGPSASLVVSLKPPGPDGPALNGLRRVSRPGLRVYAGATEVPRVLGGLGVAVVSTSRGLMSDRAARSSGLGGEIVAHVW